MKPMRWWRVPGILALVSCGSGPTSPSQLATECHPTASSAKTASPTFNRPFRGDFPIGDLFDHDKPVPFGDGNNYLLSMCGSQVADQSNVNGHNGYDWRMPEGTPLLAVADGLVMHAGLEQPFNCPPLGRTVQAIYVQLRHRGADGLEYISIYGHLSRVGVAEGDLVTSGATVGWSGNTGCSGTPHLHFGTFKGLEGNFAPIDPYGWHASTPDPWEADPRGAASVWLWKDGEAPRIR
jgi:murein DD-endopeptidase MepM/ murein hydrolase activator NlpD